MAVASARLFNRDLSPRESARNIQWGGRALFNRAAGSRNNRRIFLL